MRLTIDVNGELRHVFNQTLRRHIGTYYNEYKITNDDKLLINNSEILYKLVTDILKEFNIKMK